MLIVSKSALGDLGVDLTRRAFETSSLIILSGKLLLHSAHMGNEVEKLA
jgi:hypothetical protein